MEARRFKIIHWLGYVFIAMIKFLFISGKSITNF